MGKSWSQSAWIPTPPITEDNICDQSGKVFIITGGNAGVGLQLVKILYRANARIYMAGRSEQRVTEAIQVLCAAIPDSKGSLLWLPLDLADLRSIKGAVENFLTKETRLDVLWNNAGVMFPSETVKSEQGYDLQMSTNVLGPYLLSKLLYPILKDTAETAPLNSVRVCWASSLLIELSPHGGVDMDESESPILSNNRFINYFVSKAANNLLAYEYGRRYKIANILSMSFNPGNLNTDLTRHLLVPYLGLIQRMLQGLVLWPTRYGAYTELYAGLSSDLTIAKDSGAYIWPWGRVGYLRSDIEDSLRLEVEGGTGKAAKLWAWCDQETARFTWKFLMAGWTVRKAMIL